MGFTRTLSEVLSISYRKLRNEGISWAIVGSAATALQGVHLSPGDIDLLMQTPAAVFDFSEMMSPLTPAEPVHDLQEWYSWAEVPVLADDPDPQKTVWTFGRWRIGGFKVEAAHIQPPADYLEVKREGSGIWECGPEVWPHIKHVPWGDYELVVVPLEIQLHTCMSRELDDRVHRIVAVMRSEGYDGRLIDLSLTGEQKTRFNDSLRQQNARRWRQRNGRDHYQGY